MRFGMLLATTLLLWASVIAQEEAPLAQRFEAAMRVASPKAQLVPIPPSQSEGRRFRRWHVPNEGDIDVQYYVFQYVAGATSFFRMQPELLSAPTAPVSKLADEAFVSIVSGVNAQRITFRRGRVVVSVRAPAGGLGESNSLKIARVLVSEIDRSVAAGDLDQSFYDWTDPR